MNVSRKHLAAAGAFAMAVASGSGVALAQPYNCGSAMSPYGGTCIVDYNDLGYSGIVVNTTGGGVGVS